MYNPSQQYSLHIGMFTTCGFSVGSMYHKLFINPSLTHILPMPGGELVYNSWSYTTTKAQLTTLFYTVYKQQISGFISVIDQFVHIIHIAYKKNENSKERYY